jgi:5-methylcytosine-specific restriction protein A
MHSEGLKINMKIRQPFDFNTRKGRQAFYQSSEWKQIRDVFLNANPLCKHCLRKGKTVAAFAVDHMVDIVDEPHNALNMKNFQGLCKSCHSIKTTEERYEKLKLKTRKWDI